MTLPTTPPTSGFFARDLHDTRLVCNLALEFLRSLTAAYPLTSHASTRVDDAIVSLTLFIDRTALPEDNSSCPLHLLTRHPLASSAIPTKHG